MTGTDDFHFGVQIFFVQFAIGFFQRLCQSGQGGCRSLLHEQVSIVCMGKSIHYQIYRIVQRHHEARHVRIGNRDRLAFHHLLHPKGNHRTTAGHHVAITCTTDGGPGTLAQLTAFGHSHFFHQRLAHAHGIDGIGRLIC